MHLTLAAQPQRLVFEFEPRHFETVVGDEYITDAASICAFYWWFSRSFNQAWVAEGVAFAMRDTIWTQNQIKGRRPQVRQEMFKKWAAQTLDIAGLSHGQELVVGQLYHNGRGHWVLRLIFVSTERESLCLLYDPLQRNPKRVKLLVSEVPILQLIAEREGINDIGSSSNDKKFLQSFAKGKVASLGNTLVYQLDGTSCMSASLHTLYHCLQLDGVKEAHDSNLGRRWLLGEMVKAISHFYYERQPPMTWAQAREKVSTVNITRNAGDIDACSHHGCTKTVHIACPECLELMCYEHAYGPCPSYICASHRAHRALGVAVAPAVAVASVSTRSPSLKSKRGRTRSGAVYGDS